MQNLLGGGPFQMTTATFIALEVAATDSASAVFLKMPALALPRLLPRPACPTSAIATLWCGSSVSGAIFWQYDA